MHIFFDVGSCELVGWSYEGSGTATHKPIMKTQLLIHPQQLIYPWIPDATTKPQHQISIIGTMDQLRPRNLWYNKRILFLFVSWVFFYMRDQVLKFTRILGIWNGQWIRIGWFICSSLQFLWRKLRFQISMHQFSMCQISTLGINYDQWQPQNPLMQHHFSVEGWQLGSYLY